MSRPRNLFAPIRTSGFGSYQDPAGNWIPYPLIRFTGESVLRNPINGAVYNSVDEANGAVGENQVTEFRNQAAFNTYIAGYSGDIYRALLNAPPFIAVEEDTTDNPIDQVSVASRYPDIAAIILEFYEKYLGVGPAQVDDAGLNFWTQVVVNDGAAGYANAERGFRQSALDQGIFTTATLPAPQYFSLGDTGGVNDVSTTDTETDVTTDDDDDGVVGGIQNAVGGIFDKLEESTGISRNYLQLGAAALGIGALLYFNSDGGSPRKRR